MKWIGQHIWSLISRFRSDVYLENIADGTVANDKFLGLDSNNKIVKETITSSSGDITGVKFTADTTEEVSVTSGNADFIISGGNAINTDINNSSGAIEINHDDTSSQASVNNSGRTFIQDITLDTYGHVTAITSATDSDTHVGDITSVTTGTGLSGGGNSGDLTLTASGIGLLNLSSAFYQTSDEVFQDNDITIMTSAAINDRIQSFGYTTNTGDITGVDLTGTLPINISSETNTTSGSYSATISINVGNGLNIADSGYLVINNSEINHDSLNNFVAAEHYRWDTDISGTATINAANIPTLNQSTTGSAATLTTARNIAGVAFDGSADISLNNNAITNGAGYTTNTGDITDVGIQTDSGTGSKHIVSSGSAVLGFFGSNGVDVTNITNSVTVQAVPGEIDHDSLLNFVAAEHVDWAGASAGTIHSSNIPTLNQDTTGNAATATALTSGNKTISGDLTVTSGTSGDATLIISADTDNNDENDNARLWFKQDGDITEGAIQMTSNVMNIISNVNGLGGISFRTGSTNNTGTTDPATNTAERMLVASNGDVIIKDMLKMGTTNFANSSGVIQVATQGNIDHDSLANFVANEHIDWTSASAGTIHSTNIPTLNQSTTGNAATATKLAATKTIAGVAFDGSTNISLNNLGIVNGAGYVTTDTNTQLSNAEVIAAIVASTDISTSNKSTIKTNIGIEPPQAYSAAQVLDWTVSQTQNIHANNYTNTTYSISAIDDGDTSKKIRLTGSDSSTDDITLEVGAGLSIDRSSDTIKISNTVSDTNTQLSNAEVRTAVEAASDSNVFTDADHTKLNNIETGATADQTAGEIRTLLGTGNGNLVPAAGSSGEFLKHDGSFGVPKPTESFVMACSDETSDLTAGTAKVTFRIPYAFTITAVRASVNTAPVGSALAVDINESGSTILSTKLTIDAEEKTSTTAATAAVISDSDLADDAEITVDIDSVGSETPGKGLKVTLIGNQA